MVVRGWNVQKVQWHHGRKWTVSGDDVRKHKVTVSADVGSEPAVVKVWEDSPVHAWWDVPGK